MMEGLEIEPIDRIPSASGSAPVYLVPFDKVGKCEGPKTLEHVLGEARSGPFNHVHIISHGWNNVFKDAVSLYREFFTGYFDLRKANGISDQDYKPLLIGIIWPSTALVSDDDATPRFAATLPPEVEEADQFAKQALASEIRDEDVARFHELANLRRALSHDEALEFAHLLMPILDRKDPVGEEISQKVTPERLVKAWEDAQRPAAQDRSRQTGEAGMLPVDEEAASPAPVPQQPASAGFFDFLDPVKIVRTASVFQMKDRAGTVGSFGVSPIVQELAGLPLKIHLTGHSFGAKVVLSALCHPDADLKVRSMLLLQPAVNYLCFAKNIQGHPGGYVKALDRVELPILTTFSSHDSPLTAFFHVALRRDGDLAEQRIAGAPSQFAALGGFGPGGMEDGTSTTLDIAGPPEQYKLQQPGIRLIALDGSKDARINSHGDVRNRFTEWALVNLVRQQ
jgi:hypothetical protein